MQAFMLCALLFIAAIESCYKTELPTFPDYNLKHKRVPGGKRGSVNQLVRGDCPLQRVFDRCAHEKN